MVYHDIQLHRSKGHKTYRSYAYIHFGSPAASDSSDTWSCFSEGTPLRKVDDRYRTYSGSCDSGGNAPKEQVTLI